MHESEKNMTVRGFENLNSVLATVNLHFHEEVRGLRTNKKKVRRSKSRKKLEKLASLYRRRAASTACRKESPMEATYDTNASLATLQSLRKLLVHQIFQLSTTILLLNDLENEFLHGILQCVELRIPCRRHTCRQRRIAIAIEAKGELARRVGEYEVHRDKTACKQPRLQAHDAV